MALLPHALVDAPRLFLWVSLGCGGAALLLWLWLARRMVRAVLGRNTHRVGVMRYVLVLVVSLMTASVSLASLMLCAALSGYRAYSARTLVAEVQCIELAPQQLRVYYVPILVDGSRGATSTYDVDGDEWTVGGEVLRFQPFLVGLGVPALHAVTRVEGRWQSANQANEHRATAHAVGEDVGARWRWLKRYGTRGPLRWVVSGAHGQAVSQLPDRRAIYDLFVTPNGYVLDKRSM